MNTSKEMLAAYEKLKNEIYHELRFTLQFALSHHFLIKTSISDLPAPFEQLRQQMIEAFWAMIPLRILIILDKDKQNSCSLQRFVQLASDLKFIDPKKKADLDKQIEALRNSDELKTAKALRDTVIAHSDKKKPVKTKMITSPMINDAESIFIAAGGNPLDKKDLERKLGYTWNAMFELMRKGIQRH